MVSCSVPGEGPCHPFCVWHGLGLWVLKVAAWAGTAGPFPDSLRLGFNRKELAWAPVFGTDTPTDGVSCTVPGTNEHGYVVSMPSFIATLNAKGQAGQSPTAGGDSNNQNSQSSFTGVNVDWVQYFATGTVATALANNNDIRSVLLAQAFPAAAGTYDPTAECVRAWVVSSPDHATALKQWWASQQLPGIPYQILDSQHSTNGGVHRQGKYLGLQLGSQDNRRSFEVTWHRRKTFHQQISRTKVRAAIALGATSIKCTKQADGNWTLETN